MHDEPLDPLDRVDHDNLSQSAIDHLDQQIIRALEVAPDPTIPAAFAARVAGRLPARRPVSLTPTHYGQKAAQIGVVVTFAALLVLALYATRHATGDAALGLLESVLFAQFLALIVWFTVWRHSLR
jgi:hypothetical protein